MATGRQGRVAFEGHKRDQEQIRSVHVRTQEGVRGSRSSYTADDGAVAFGLELMSCLPGPPDDDPPVSSWLDSSVNVLRYCRTLKKVREVVVTLRRNTVEIALHVLRVGGAHAAGGDSSEQIIQRRQVQVQSVYGVHAQCQRGSQKGIT